MHHLRLQNIFKKKADGHTYVVHGRSMPTKKKESVENWLSEKANGKPCQSIDNWPRSLYLTAVVMLRQNMPYEKSVLMVRKWWCGGAKTDIWKCNYRYVRDNEIFSVVPQQLLAAAKECYTVNIHTHTWQVTPAYRDILLYLFRAFVSVVVPSKEWEEKLKIWFYVFPVFTSNHDRNPFKKPLQ